MLYQAFWSKLMNCRITTVFPNMPMWTRFIFPVHDFWFWFWTCHSLQILTSQISLEAWPQTKRYFSPTELDFVFFSSLSTQKLHLQVKSLSEKCVLENNKTTLPCCYSLPFIWFLATKYRTGRGFTFFVTVHRIIITLSLNGTVSGLDPVDELSMGFVYPWAYSRRCFN